MHLFHGCGDGMGDLHLATKLVFAACKHSLFVRFSIFQGDYRVNGRLTDEETGEEIACYDVEFTVQQKVEEDDWWNWW